MHYAPTTHNVNIYRTIIMMMRIHIFRIMEYVRGIYIFIFLIFSLSFMLWGMDLSHVTLNIQNSTVTMQYNKDVEAYVQSVMSHRNTVRTWSYNRSHSFESNTMVRSTVYYFICYNRYVRAKVYPPDLNIVKSIIKTILHIHS